MQHLNDLNFFVQLVHHGGFAPTARAAEVPAQPTSPSLRLLFSRRLAPPAPNELVKLILRHVGDRPILEIVSIPAKG
jgi:hypothetical protein